jgi:hypothetical protein
MMEKAAGWIKRRFVLVTTVYICADGGMKLLISPESTEKLGSFLFFLSCAELLILDRAHKVIHRYA